MKDKPILLVEDDPADREFVLWALKKNHVTNKTVLAGDGMEALDYLFGRGEPQAGRNPSALPVLVLLDLKLPKLGGLEVLKAIRADARTRTLPVIVFTSSSEEKDALISYCLGTNGYLCKPLDFEKFNQAALKLGLLWTLSDAPKPERPGRIRAEDPL